MHRSVQRFLHRPSDTRLLQRLSDPRSARPPADTSGRETMKLSLLVHERDSFLCLCSRDFVQLYRSYLATLFSQFHLRKKLFSVNYIIDIHSCHCSASLTRSPSINPSKLLSSLNGFTPQNPEKLKILFNRRSAHTALLIVIKPVHTPAASRPGCYLKASGLRACKARSAGVSINAEGDKDDCESSVFKAMRRILQIYRTQRGIEVSHDELNH